MKTVEHTTEAPITTEKPIVHDQNEQMLDMPVELTSTSDQAETAPKVSTIIDYTKLQQKLDWVIGKIGLCRTIKLIEGFISNTSLGINDSEKFKLIATYIIDQSIQIFDLKAENFYKSKIREYRDARMACYHLLKLYTDCSYAKIGESFDQRKRNVLYYCQKCDEQLSIPQFYEVFAHRYQLLENRTIEFIAKLS